MSFFPRLLTVLFLGGCLASCGTKKPSEEAPGGNQTATEPTGNATASASSSGFFPKLLPPHPEHLREAEKQVFHIYYDLDGIPESWIEEWKAGRDLKCEQHPLPTGTREWPKNADLIIAPPDRLSHDLIQILPSNASSVRANPVFLKYPFDPQQQWTRPWRWTPWVVMRQAPATDAAHPAAEPGEMLRPDRPVLLKSWWLKSLNHSVNHVPDKAMEDKWTSELAAHKTPPEPVAALWDKLTSGQASSALMPLAWKLRQNSASLSWTVPATGTVIHFDQLAMGSATDQPQLVLEWITFLTDAARQKMLLSATGYYPVQVPLGREIPDHTGPTPPWWNRSEFPVGQPAPEPEPVAPPAAVALPATAPATPTPAAPETSPPVVQDTPPPDTSPAPPPADQSPEITPTSPPPAQPAH